jgi:hypothetical protein
MDIYYCGFNGFKQVPVGASSDTLTCLTLHTKGAQVRLGKDPTEHKFLAVFWIRICMYPHQIER